MPNAEETRRAPPDYVEIGAASTYLLYDDSSWIKRRKDSIVLLDDQWARRQVTLDFVLTDELRELANDECQPLLFYVPLVLFPKKPRSFMRFDVHDEGDRSLPLMTRQENALVSVHALYAAARQAIGEKTNAHDVSAVELEDEIRKDLRAVAAATPDAALNARRLLLDTKDSLRGVRNALRASQRFKWFSLLLAENSIAVGQVLDDRRSRRILKLSYEERVVDRTHSVDHRDLPDARSSQQGLRAYPVVIRNPYIGSSTYHFEFEAPDGLEAVGARLLDERGNDLTGKAAPPSPAPAPDEDAPDPEAAAIDKLVAEAGIEPDRGTGEGTRVHLYLPDATLATEARVWIGLRVRRERFISEAAVAASAISVVLMAYVWFADQLVENGASAPALLLLFPGLIATLIGRAGGHFLISRLLRRARYLTFISGAYAFAAAFALVINGTGPAASPGDLLRPVWILLFLFSLWPTLILCLARHLPRPTDQASWPEKVVSRIERVRGSNGAAK